MHPSINSLICNSSSSSYHLRAFPSSNLSETPSLSSSMVSLFFLLVAIKVVCCCPVVARVSCYRMDHRLATWVFHALATWEGRWGAGGNTPHICVCPVLSCLGVPCVAECALSCALDYAACSVYTQIMFFWRIKKNHHKNSRSYWIVTSTFIVYSNPDTRYLFPLFLLSPCQVIYNPL